MCLGLRGVRGGVSEKNLVTQKLHPSPYKDSQKIIFKNNGSLKVPSENYFKSPQ